METTKKNGMKVKSKVTLAARKKMRSEAVYVRWLDEC